MHRPVTLTTNEHNFFVWFGSRHIIHRSCHRLIDWVIVQDDSFFGGYVQICIFLYQHWASIVFVAAIICACVIVVDDYVVCGDNVIMCNIWVLLILCQIFRQITNQVISDISLLLKIGYVSFLLKLIIEWFLIFAVWSIFARINSLKRSICKRFYWDLTCFKRCLSVPFWVTLFDNVFMKVIRILILDEYTVGQSVIFVSYFLILDRTWPFLRYFGRYSTLSRVSTDAWIIECEQFMTTFVRLLRACQWVLTLFLTHQWFVWCQVVSCLNNCAPWRAYGCLVWGAGPKFFHLWRSPGRCSCWHFLVPLGFWTYSMRLQRSSHSYLVYFGPRWLNIWQVFVCCVHRILSETSVWAKSAKLMLLPFIH